MNRTQLTLIGCGLAGVLFFAVNIAANATLRPVRVDLTEDKVFTLDEGSKLIARGVDEPINLYFYLSRNPLRKHAVVLEYAERVHGMLREFARASQGKIRLSVIDPEPFSEEEDRAVEQGIQGAPDPDTGEPIYFGLVGTSATDAKEVIPFFTPDERKQRTVEYDLSKLIWTLAHPEKRKVGILTPLSIAGGGGNPMLGQQGEPRWQILDELEAFYEVEVLPASTDDSADLSELDALVVIHPRGFADSTLFLIDQWALEGKPLIVFVDPQCDVDPGESNDPTNMMARYMAKKDSDLEKLFKAWGFELAKGKVACDRQLGVRENMRSRDGRSTAELTHVSLIRLGEEQTSREDPVTRLLGELMLLTPGSLRKLPEGTTTFTPLVQTSEESQEVDSSQFQFPNPQELLASFMPSYERLTLGARVAGSVKSAFPEGKPGGADEAPADDDLTDGEELAAEGTDGEEAEKSAKAGSLTESKQPLNLVVFSDVDMLHNELWMRSLGQFAGTMMVQRLSDNADLFRNAVESTLGGEELMGIRVRGKTTRPFERVQAIQREADQRFLARQQDLERRLQDAERRLKELQKAQDEGSQELVTAAQRQEEEKVREEFVQTRRDLRDVKHQLRKDIERLGTTLKWLNIALVPALVCAAAVALGTYRAKQRGRDQRSNAS